MQRFYPIGNKEVTEPNTQPLQIDVMPEVTREESLVSTFAHNRELIFDVSQGCLKRVIFSQFGDYVFDLKQGFYLNNPDLIFTQEKLDEREAIFSYQDEQKRITKHFDYSDQNFVIKLGIDIENVSEQPISFSDDLILGIIELNSRQLDSRFKEAFLQEPDRILRLNPARRIKIYDKGKFFGLRDRYFCVILIPLSYPERFQLVRLTRTSVQMNLSREIIKLLPGQILSLQYKVYLGPQEANLLRLFDRDAEGIIYYGIFDPIAKLLLNLLRFFFRIIRNWGGATILLSVFIFIILFPLSLKQMRSVKEMQHLQPKIEELRRLYKDNPQRLNKETLELYRKNKINPLGGCLPMILQIPIFFSLYQALMRSIELKGANFLWIKDLSQPDRLIINPEVNILPILMAITMFFQQRFSLASSPGASSEQQRLMSLLFPALFGIIFYRMPSGLVLYWFINSLLMFIYQTRIKFIHESEKH